MITLPIIFFSQEIQHDAIAINIEVPVRVYKGRTFIDDLTIADFEIYEDGILQKTEAVYLIKKTNIERGKSRSRKAKDQTRNIQKFCPHVRDQ